MGGTSPPRPRAPRREVGSADLLDQQSGPNGCPDAEHDAHHLTHGLLSARLVLSAPRQRHDGHADEQHAGDHLAQTTVVDSDGKIYRQVYGVDIETQSIVEPLKELVFDTPRSAGFIEHWISTFKLFCTVYDPNSDRYRFDYSIFMTLFAGFLSLGAIATFIVREWRRAR